MRIYVKLGTLVAVTSALAIAVPAAAHSGNPHHHPNNGSHPAGVSRPSQSHQCKPHSVAYVESGIVDGATASTLAANPDGTWSGTLVVKVTTANHWAKADKRTTVSYTFTNAKLSVHFNDGAIGFAAGEHIRLIGKLAAVAKKCTALAPAPAPVFRKVVVHLATA